MRSHVAKSPSYGSLPQNVVDANPAADLEMPSVRDKLPRDVLTAEETEVVLLQPHVGTPLGLRDRAMMETFYATGIRRFELIGLRLYDVDAARGTLFVAEGKGRKERIVPIGERALQWIERYCISLRKCRGVMCRQRAHARARRARRQQGTRHRHLSR